MDRSSVKKATIPWTPQLVSPVLGRKEASRPRHPPHLGPRFVCLWHCLRRLVIVLKTNFGTICWQRLWHQDV